MTGAAIARFWSRAEPTAEAEGWTVRLDGKAIRTPGGRTLLLPGAALAAAIAAEWAAAGERFSLATLSLTRLAATCLDRVQPLRADIEAELLRYAESDTLRHRAERPEALAARQAALWDPPLAWVLATHGAALPATTGLLPAGLDSAAAAALSAALRALDPWALTALAQIVPATGSLSLGLMGVAGAMEADALHEAGCLDELWQIERWGADAEAQARLAGLLDEIAAALAFLNLARA